MNAVALDLKEGIPVVEEGGRPAVLASHVDLDSEALVEGALGVIGQEEVAVGAEFGTPQHSFCLNPSKSHGCLLYTSPSPRDVEESRMPSSA